MNKKIGPLLLSGLIIGPILGSGVILLPPLTYGKLGASSIWAWIIIMALGVVFALIFVKLSVLYPGDGGMTIAIEKALGKTPKLYASLLMIASVTFGPVAVISQFRIIHCYCHSTGNKFHCYSHTKQY